MKRWLLGPLSLLGVLLAAEVISAILRAPGLIWNQVRIARSVALLHGYSLYPARDVVGAVIGTLHTPMSHCLYLLISGLRTPTRLVVAGSALSATVILASLAWVLLRAGGLTMATAVAFLFCGFLTVQMPGTCYTLTGIHTDAAALALATVTCGILCGRHGKITGGHVWISGSACALVIACKQTLFPLALGIVLFVALTTGWRMASQFVAAAAVTGSVVLAAIGVFVPMSAFLFNTVTLAAHRPLKSNALDLLADAMRTSRLEALPALIPMAMLLAEQWVSSETRWRTADIVRAVVRGNRWLVFPFAAACLAPVCAKATITIGGDVNHLGIVVYLLFVGAALAIQENLRASREFPRVIAGLTAVIGIMASAEPGGVFTIRRDLRNVALNDSERAFHYVSRHGEETYFPWHPTASLLVSGRLYHFDYALYDRELGHAPLTAEQMQAGLPNGFKRVAMPPGREPTSDELRRLVAGWAVVEDPELPGWKIFENPAPR